MQGVQSKNGIGSDFWRSQELKKIMKTEKK